MEWVQTVIRAKQWTPLELAAVLLLVVLWTLHVLGVWRALYRQVRRRWYAFIWWRLERRALKRLRKMYASTDFRSEEGFW